MPEGISPQLSEDLYLIKKLEVLHLWNKGVDSITDGNTKRRFMALETLDYCYNAERMAERTGVPMMEIESLSNSARQALAVTATKLIKTAYNTEPLNRVQVDPNSFSRPLAIFITSEDMSKIHQKENMNTRGLAISQARAAIVATIPIYDIYVRQTKLGTKTEANWNSLLAVTIHEFGHLLRLTQQERSHYKHMPSGRLYHCLEEGGTELLTGTTLEEGWPNDPLGEYQPHAYKEAARRIQDGLVSKVARIFIDNRYKYDDLPLSGDSKDAGGEKYTQPDETVLKEILLARFMLGDYDLLARVSSSWTSSRYSADEMAKVNFWQKRNLYNGVKGILETAEVFGFEVMLSNSVIRPERDEEGDVVPIWMDDNVPYIPLPAAVPYGAGELWRVLKPEYKYEIVKHGAKEGFQPVEADKIPFDMDWRIRVNFLEVIPDRT